MNDRTFLLWLRDRLVHVYGESPNADFVHKLTGIVYAHPADADSPWIDPYVKNLGDVAELKDLAEGRRI